MNNSSCGPSSRSRNSTGPRRLLRAAQADASRSRLELRLRLGSELSDKVLRGGIKIAQQGFWAGGKPPYALQRLLLDESHRPLHTLMAGQRKSIQNQRVTLALGDECQVATVRRIFHEFVQLRRPPREIASALNNEGVPSPGGKAWDTGKVHRVLANQPYPGTLVYNKTTDVASIPRFLLVETIQVQTNLKRAEIDTFQRNRVRRDVELEVVDGDAADTVSA